MLDFSDFRKWDNVNGDMWLPKDFDSSDWRYGKGLREAWYRFVCWYACHWVAPIHLRALQQVEPGWLIHSSREHTHCRNGDRLYDPNAVALQFDPMEEMGYTEVYDLDSYLDQWIYE
jgi:hypothetical protein